MTYRKGPEYQSAIGVGKRFAVVAGLALTAACSAEIQASPTAEIFPTQPQATEIVPTPSPVDRIGDEMAELAQLPATPEPTATPNYQELQALKPAGVEGEVIMGENGRPQLYFELDKFNDSEKIVAGEYVNGAWQLLSFSITKTPDEIIKTIKSSNYSNYLYDMKSGVSRESMLYKQITGQIVGFELDNENNTNSVNLRWIILYRGRLFKIEPDILILQESGSDVTEEIDIQNLDIKEVVGILQMIDNQIPDGNTMFRFDIYSFLEDTDANDARGACNIYGKNFQELCNNLIHNNNREVVSLRELNRLVESHAYIPNDSQIRSGVKFWDDTDNFSTIGGSVITVGSIKIFR